MESLPASFALPFQFDLELVSLQVTQLRARVEKERKALDLIYNKLATAVNQSGGSYSREDFDWAYCVCRTRMVDATGLNYEDYQENIPWLKLRTRHDNSILAPIFDMINHSNRANADYWYDGRTGSLKVGLLNDLSPGKQLFIDYGPRPDDYLFQCYGFCLKPGDNEMNRIDLHMDELYDACKQLGIDDFWDKIALLEQGLATDIDLMSITIDYDRLWVNLKEIEAGLWTILVWVTGGDLESTASLTHNGVEFMESDEIQTRIKCIEVLLICLKKRLVCMKENDNIIRSRKVDIDDFTMKIMRNIRLSHSDIIFLW